MGGTRRPDAGTERNIKSDTEKTMRQETESDRDAKERRTQSKEFNETRGLSDTGTRIDKETPEQSKRNMGMRRETQRQRKRRNQERNDAATREPRGEIRKKRGPPRSDPDLPQQQD